MFIVVMVSRPSSFCFVNLCKLFFVWFGVFLLTSAQETSEKFGTLADFVLVENGLFRGDFSRGIPHGFGTLIYFTDDSRGRYNYTGKWKNGKRHGEGTTVFRGQEKTYDGNYENDLENGRGKVTFSNGDIFEGFFDNGLREGSGRIILSNGASREGEWRDDKLQGFVFFKTKNGTTNIERWEKGRRKEDGAKERDRNSQSNDKTDEDESDTLQSNLKFPSNYTREALKVKTFQIRHQLQSLSNNNSTAINNISINSINSNDHIEEPTAGGEKDERSIKIVSDEDDDNNLAKPKSFFNFQLRQNEKAKQSLEKSVTVVKRQERKLLKNFYENVH